MNYLGLVDTSHVSDGYEKYIWIGFECVDAIQDCIERSLPYEVLSDLKFGRGEYLQTLDYYWECMNFLLTYAEKELNEYHHINYCRQQWFIILGQWLQLYISSFLYKYRKCMQLFETIKIPVEIELSHFNQEVNIIDTADYRIQLGTDDFNSMLYAILLCELNVPEWFVIKNKEIRYKRPVERKQKKDWRQHLLQVNEYLTDVYKKIFRIRDKVIFSNPYLPLSFWVKDVIPGRRGKFVNHPFEYTSDDRMKLPEHPRDSIWRTKAREKKGKDEFQQILYRYFFEFIPMACVEGFSYLQNKKEKLYKQQDDINAIVYSAQGITHNEVLKLLLADRKGTQTELYCIQHGGDYGIQHYAAMDVEFIVSDHEITWGWKIENDNRTDFIPMPAAKLMHGRYLGKSNGDKILLVDYESDKYVSWMVPYQIQGASRVDSIINFMSLLDPIIQKQITYRFYPHDMGHHIRERMQKKYPYIKLDKTASFYDALEGARLVVCTMLATTWLEALAAGKAIIVLSDYSCTEESAVADMKELQRVGVLVETWEELAGQINRINGRIDDWWLEEDRQKVIKRIMNKYMYMPDNARDIWKNFLWTLADR